MAIEMKNVVSGLIEDVSPDRSADFLITYDTSVSDIRKVKAFRLTDVLDGDKGDITVSSSGTVWTIDNTAVTYAKIQNISATDKLLGRSSVGAGSIEEIVCTAAGRALIDDVDASAQRTTLGLGTIATQNSNNVSITGGSISGLTSLSISGNLTVSGTTTTVNSTTVTLSDPIITLGGDTAPTSDDNKDRGVEFRWHTGSAAKVGFFGYDDSTGRFTFIPDATNASEVFSGSVGAIDVSDVYIGGTASTGTGGVVRATSPTLVTPRITSTSEQIRIGYDANNYYATTVGSTGAVTLDAVGTGAKFTFSDVVEVPSDAYAAGWSGKTEVPTKGALYTRLEAMKIESLVIAASDETTALTTGTAKVKLRMPYAFTLTGVRASLSTAQTSGNILTINIKEAGTSIFSTKLTINNGATTSVGATTPAVLSDTSLADNAEISIDIDQIGDSTAKGLKIILLGYPT